MKVLMIALTLYSIVFAMFFVGSILTTGQTVTLGVWLKILLETLTATLITTPFIALGVLVIRGGFTIGFWSVILGICSLTSWFIVVLGFPVSLASIIVGVIAFTKKPFRVPGFIGVLFGAIGMVASLFMAKFNIFTGAPFF